MVSRILLNIIFKNKLVKSWNDSVNNTYLFVLFQLMQCTWSVILRFRGSPPSRSNCTKPKSKTLHGNCNKIQIDAATTFLAVRFSSISNWITSVVLPIESIFELEMKHLLERAFLNQINFSKVAFEFLQSSCVLCTLQKYLSKYLSGFFY